MRRLFTAIAAATLFAAPALAQGAAPAGAYVFYSALAAPGTLNLVTPIATAVMVVTP